VGLSLGLGAPLGVPAGALVGGSVLPAVFGAASAAESVPGLSLVALVLGIGLWGAALGSTVASCEEAAGRGWSWAAAWRVVYRPAGALSGLALLLPAQVVAVVAGPFRNPPGFCFGERRLPPGMQPLAVADLDGDRDLDVLQHAPGSPGLGLLRNDGGGSFSPAPGPADPLRPVDVATGDVDADGDTDVAGIVVEPRRTSFEQTRRSVAVVHNDGRGVFSPLSPVPLAAEARALEIADLDGDGRADVLVTTPDGPALFWSRSGGIEPGPRLPVMGLPTIADVDGDGRNDLVSVTRPGDIHLHRNLGEGRFESSVVARSGYVSDLAVGDLDGDGDLDLVVGRTRHLELLANVGGGRFVLTETLPGGLNNSWLATGDLDADGDVDVVASEGPDGEDETDGMVWAWENGGEARWSDAGRIGTTRERVIVADMTGDGRADVLSGDMTAARPDWRVRVARPC
jgi:FG-GAP-like repeat